MAPPLPGPLAHLAPLLDQYGYLAVGMMIFIEDFGLPFPGETTLLTAAIYAGAGQLNLAVVIVTAVVAAISGDNLGYLIGRTGGRAFIHRWGHYVLLPPERFRKAEDFFARHGGKVVTVARFIPGLREANGIVAGTIGMPWLRFLAFNALGAALWVGVWAGLGYTAGTHIGELYDEIERYFNYLLAALAVLAVALIARHLFRHRHTRRRSGEQSDGQSSGQPDPQPPVDT